ncbi:MAG: hypothetical protein HKP58_18980 [Desulfatitalea sp.]|nr:hypothetical protein [Desulfatitalea sp.]NNK02500.1 hypothetical protein [Desulfatitalea sp.]
MSAKEEKKGGRLPIVRTEADIQALSHLSPEEKALAVKNINMVTPTVPYLMVANDPELLSFVTMMEWNCVALHDPDFQVIPFSPMNLITHVVARHTGSEYLLALITAMTVAGITDAKKENIYYTKLSMVEFPDSDLWTDEQRITIKFTKGALEHNISDELFEQARELWGEKRLLRHLFWISISNMWGIIQSALDIKVTSDMLPSGYAWTPEAIEALRKKFSKSKEGIMALWDSWSPK